MPRLAPETHNKQPMIHGEDSEFILKGHLSDPIFPDNRVNIEMRLAHWWGPSLQYFPFIPNGGFPFSLPTKSFESGNETKCRG